MLVMEYRKQANEEESNQIMIIFEENKIQETVWMPVGKVHVRWHLNRDVNDVKQPVL